MALVHFGGSALVASTRARAGWRLATSTVRNIRKGPVPRLPEAAPADGSVPAQRLGHIWISDITFLKGLFGLIRLSIVSLFDVYSVIVPIRLPPIAAPSATLRRTDSLFGFSRTAFGLRELQGVRVCLGPQARQD
jgi:hypothetical protein